MDGSGKRWFGHGIIQPLILMSDESSVVAVPASYSGPPSCDQRRIRKWWMEEGARVPDLKLNAGSTEGFVYLSVKEVRETRRDNIARNGEENDRFNTSVSRLLFFGAMSQKADQCGPNEPREMNDIAKRSSSWGRKGRSLALWVHRFGSLFAPNTR